MQAKIRFYSTNGNISEEQVETFKKEIIEKNLKDDYNSTVKFVNCLNRLKLHFDNLFLSNLDEVTTMHIINLITKQELLSEVVKEKER